MIFNPSQINRNGDYFFKNWWYCSDRWSSCSVCYLLLDWYRVPYTLFDWPLILFCRSYDNWTCTEISNINWNLLIYFYTKLWLTVRAAAPAPIIEPARTSHQWWRLSIMRDIEQNIPHIATKIWHNGRAITERTFGIRFCKYQIMKIDAYTLTEECPEGNDLLASRMKYGR